MSVRVAVLGAGGQIGRTLLGRLAADPSLDVVGICRNELTAAPLRLAGFDVRCGDLVDERGVDRLLGDREVVVNCASATALWGQARREDRATVDAVLSARSLRRIVHFSSIAVYGTCVDPAHNTYERPRPDQPYGKDKLDLERYVTRGAKAKKRGAVVFRLGHVYGAEQWVSRFVFDRAKEGFRLPFDGRLASNAVHVSNVASAVRTVVVDPRVEGTFNLVDPNASTWREVFDWNTSAAGLRPVASLDEAASERVRAIYAARARTPAPVAVAREVAAWARGLPISLVSASPALRDLALSTLSTLQWPELEQRLLAKYASASVRRVTEPLPVSVTHSWMLSEGAPGPRVHYPAEVTARDAEAVARWYRGYASPEALAPAEPLETSVVATA